VTCIRIPGGIITLNDSYRLRLEDGTCVFMSWHHYCGPEFYRDRSERRYIDEWWENPLIVKALDWFVGRGEKA
jgi:hypothetical protein